MLRMLELYVHSTMRLHGVMLNYISPGITLLFHNGRQRQVRVAYLLRIPEFSSLNVGQETSIS
jgi:hypothetical protein